MFYVYKEEVVPFRVTVSAKDPHLAAFLKHVGNTGEDKVNPLSFKKVGWSFVNDGDDIYNSYGDLSTFTLKKARFRVHVLHNLYEDSQWPMGKGKVLFFSDRLKDLKAFCRDWKLDMSKIEADKVTRENDPDGCPGPENVTLIDTGW